MSYFVRLPGLFVSQIGKKLGISSSTSRLDKSNASGLDKLAPNEVTDKREDDRTPITEELSGNISSDDEFLDSVDEMDSTASRPVYRFGQNSVGVEPNTFSYSNEKDRDTSHEQNNESTIAKIQTDQTQDYFQNSANKKQRVDRYMGGGYKRKISSDDIDGGPDIHGSFTSDYCSDEAMVALNNVQTQLLRPLSVPEMSRQRGGVTYASVFKNVVIGSGNTVGDSMTSENTLGEHEKLEMVTEVEDRTSRILKGQKVDGVETESYKDFKSRIKQAPKFAILYGKGSNFNARKFVKDSQERFSENNDGKRLRVYILESPKEWSVVKENTECIAVLSNVTGDDKVDSKRFSKWKRKIKTEILPLLKQTEKITVVVTERSFPGKFFGGSLFRQESQDTELRQYVVNTQGSMLGERVRRRLIWHELDRYGITTCERRGEHADHNKCITEREITAIATRTTNLFFPQRIHECVWQYTRENVDLLDKPHSSFVDIMEFLKPADVLSLLALVAFGGTLLKSDIESFRSKGFNMGKHFRRSTADITQKEIRVTAIKTLTQFAEQKSLKTAMWDTIESGLIKMSGSFVRQYQHAYAFDGEAVKNAFLLSSALPLDAIISFCDPWFLHNLIAPLALQTDCEYVAFIGEGQTKAIKAMYRRLMNEIKERKVQLAWTHKLVAERWFCEEFLKFIKQEDGGLSMCLLMTDRREAYNALYFGLEQPFRIQANGKPANLTELIFQHQSYKKWREKHPKYKYLRNGHEEATLRYAIELDRVGTVEMFLKSGVQADNDCLSIAVGRENIAMVNVLLRMQKFQKTQISFESRCKALKRSLEVYSRSDSDPNVKQIFELLSYSASINYNTDSFEPLIIFATKQRDMAMLELLMAFVGETDTRTDTQTHVVAGSCESTLFERQSFEKLDLNIVSKKDETALNVAVMKGYYELITYLLQNGADQRAVLLKTDSPVFVAVLNDDPQALELLMKYDEDIVNMQDRHGKSVLHHAVEGEKLDCLKVLIAAHSLKIDVVDRRNETALHKAVVYGKDQIVELLLKAGAKIEPTDLDNNTAMDIATKLKNIYCLELLLKAARSRKLVLNDEILFRVLRSNDQRLWSIVFKYGFSVNHKSNDQLTPLAFAINMKNCGLIRFLLRHGADKNIGCNAVPLQYLCSSRKPKDQEIIKILKEFGVL